MARHYTNWTDQRFAEAYDIIADIQATHRTPDDSLRELSALMAEIDKADEMLAGILHDRRTA
jgi:hypothetical protein